MVAESKKDPIDLINQTGFPLQMLLQTLVGTKKFWKSKIPEHSVEDPNTGITYWIDLIIDNDDFQPGLRLVLECKRHLSTDWLFLIDNPNDAGAFVHTLNARKDETNEDVISWNRRKIIPSSYYSMFCVKTKEQTSDEHMLENICKNMLLTCELLAKQELSNIEPQRLKTDRVYIPIIVTTANVRACHFNSSDINLNYGNIDKLKANLQDVEMIRFVKNFKSIIADKGKKYSDLLKLHTANERTILIIQAKAFLNFLDVFSFVS